MVLNNPPSWLQGLQSWFPEVTGKNRTLSGFWAVLFTCSGAFMGGWYMYTSGFGIVSTETNRAFYLLFTSILVFLLYPATKKSPDNRHSLFDVICIILVTVSYGYWIDQYVDYAINRVSLPSQWDLIMGVIAITLTMETARRALGPALPALAIIFMA